MKEITIDIPWTESDIFNVIIFLKNMPYIFECDSNSPIKVTSYRDYQQLKLLFRTEKTNIRFCL